MSIVRPQPVELILWDVVEEHLNEAAFMLERWQKTLFAPHYSLVEVSKRIEGRLEAHLDGLRVGGEPVATRLLHPLLDEASEPHQATASALVLLASDRSADRFAPLRAIHNAEGKQRQALSLALKLFEAPFIDQGLISAFGSAEDAAQKATMLDIMAARQLDPGRGLVECLTSDHGPLLVAGVRAAGRLRRRDLVDYCERHLFDDDPAIREAAIEAGLALGSQQAWRECLAAVGEPNVSGLLLTLVASFGNRRDHRRLHARLDNVEYLESTIVALGSTGSVESGDLCLPFLGHDDERVAKVSAEALAAIAGLDLYAGQRQDPAAAGTKHLLVPLEKDDLDADLVPDGVDELPLVDAVSMSSLWSQARGRLGEDRRFVEGQPWSPQALVRALQVAPMRRRHAYARELLIRTGGLWQVDTSAFSDRQFRQLEALRNVQTHDFTVDFSGGW